MADLPGQAIWDYHHRHAPGALWVYYEDGSGDEMPLAVYFREPADMPPLERTALQKCRGSILEIGAGAGSHALLLQQKGCSVTALDISPKAAEVMRQRGVKGVVCADIFDFDTGRYDTLLLLMNGIGLAGTIQGLRRFLSHAKTLLNPGGQLLFDSSDVAYLYIDMPKPGEGYYGEVRYRYAYKRAKTNWATWLYIDQETLAAIAGEEGWDLSVLYEDEEEQYLARLTRKEG